MAFKIDINLKWLKCQNRRNYDQCLQQNKTKLLRDDVIIEFVRYKNSPEKLPRINTNLSLPLATFTDYRRLAVLLGTVPLKFS